MTNNPNLHATSNIVDKEECNKDSILIRINNKFKKISKSKIDYIASDGKYCNMYVDNRKYTVRVSLKAIGEQLPNSFLRVHASYIVNTARIESINTERCIVEFNSKKNIPYSRKYKTVLFNMYTVM